MAFCHSEQKDLAIVHQRAKEMAGKVHPACSLLCVSHAYVREQDKCTEYRAHGSIVQARPVLQQLILSPSCELSQIYSCSSWRRGS